MMYNQRVFKFFHDFTMVVNIFKHKGIIIFSDILFEWFLFLLGFNLNWINLN